MTRSGYSDNAPDVNKNTLQTGQPYAGWRWQGRALCLSHAGVRGHAKLSSVQGIERYTKEFRDVKSWEDVKLLINGLSGLLDTFLSFE